MPYHISKRNDGPHNKPWAVVKDHDGQVMGWHTSEEHAKTQLAALHASEDKRKHARRVPTYLPKLP